VSSTAPSIHISTGPGHQNPARRRHHKPRAASAASFKKPKAASALNHPNIIHIFDINSSDGIDFIAMEFVAGTALDQVD
jgi:hypothetical protein